MNNFEEAVVNSGGTLYLVGGAVRDQIMGIESKDRDYLVTGLPIDVLSDTLSKFGSVDLVGKSFGVVKFRPTGSTETYDFALPRTEVSTGTGHKDFAVHYDHTLPVEKDLGRRDFTMNAMAVNVQTKTLWDPFGGQADIQGRRIRAVFDAAFKEDPLRMVRAVQFAARFKFTIEMGTADNIRANAGLIRTVPGERIFEELKKIMERAEFPSIAFEHMKQLGLLERLFPELAKCVGVSQPKKYHDLDVFNHIMHAVDGVPSVKLHVRLAALFHDIAKPQTRSDENGEVHFLHHEHAALPMIDDIMGRLHASADLTHQVKNLVACHMFPGDFTMTDRAMRGLIKRVGPDLIYDLIDLRVGDRLASGKPFLSMGKVGHMRKLVAEELAAPTFSVKDLTLSGKDLIQMGFKPGPIFTEILNWLLEQVMADKSLNVKETLAKLVEEKYGGRK